MFRDYQINLENTANLNSSLSGGEIFKSFGKRGEPYTAGLDNPLSHVSATEVGLWGSPLTSQKIGLPLLGKVAQIYTMSFP